MVLKIFLTVLLGTSLLVPALLEAVYISGLWAVFSKCGIAGWRALIPFYRDLSLAECVDMEPEGMVCTISEAIITMLAIAGLFVAPGSVSDSALAAATLMVGLIGFNYRLRIYRALYEMFRLKPRFLFLASVFRFVSMPIWGFGKKFQPAWHIEETKDTVSEYFSGAKAKVLDAGLTVNLNKRTVKQFLKSKTLLRDVHMEIRPGHMVLLLGGSGAGKTTLLDAVIGYEKADAEIVLNGTNIYEHYGRMQYEVGYVPQLDLMRGQDTVFHTLMDAAALRLPTSFSHSERRERVEQVMQIFGLAPARNTMVEKMSGGQRKRLSIAMEFIPNPSLFILDEPDSGLDGVMARELMQQLRGIADQGKIVVVITHTPDRVIDLFDDVIVLAKDSARTGRLAFFGPIEEARTFFGENTMEGIVKCVNSKDVGGKGLADDYIRKYAEVQHG